MLRSIIDIIRPKLKAGFVLFSDLAGFQAPHGGTIPPHVLVTALRPDLVILNELSREIIIFELTCPLRCANPGQIALSTCLSTLECRF